MRIRTETEADFGVVDEIVAAAFGRADEAELVRRLRSHTDRYVPDLALVAEDNDGRVIGHVMLTYVDLLAADGSTTRVLELAPLAVAPDVQRTGAGAALTREALRRAEDLGEPMVLVLGHPSYYPRHGFEPAADHGIDAPDAAMAPAFFVARLGAFEERALRGTVDFGPAFAG